VAYPSWIVEPHKKNKEKKRRRRRKRKRVRIRHIKFGTE
jgi:hypothetical protein